MLRPNDIIGPYKLIQKLGHGAFGEVWLAERHAALVSPQLAVKFAVSDEVDVAAIKQEAEVWKLASGHPNVVPIIEADVYDGHLAIVSEYARDGSLKHWLRRHSGRAPSMDAAIEMALGMLSGLEHLHEQSIIHRDLKPDNILLQGATPRLADFGLSRVLKSSQSTHHIAGTLPYMSPETFSRVRNKQADLWAVGVILYQMLAGRLPFPQTDDASLIHAILNQPPDPLPADVPAQLQEVIARALQKDVAQRYQTAAEMRETLRQASKSIFDRQTIKIDPQPAEPPGANSPDQPINPSDIAHPRSNRRKYVAAGVVLALAIGLVMFLSRNSSAPAKASSESTSLNLAPTPTVADSPTPPASQTAALQSFTDDLGHGVKLEMVQLSGGTFVMGSDGGMSVLGDDAADEMPKHQVKVNAFAISKYEVTQAQWQAMMGSNPSSFKGADLPVHSLSWDDAVRFCQSLSNKTGKAYRLPAEAEWEYAARAGSQSKYGFGDDANLHGEYAWYDVGPILGVGPRGGSVRYPGPLPIGKKKPNAFGLYDMHGNVLEWVQDWYDKDYYKQKVLDNPKGPTSGSSRVLRGGWWGSSSFNCRSTSRFNHTPDDHGWDSDMRVVVGEWTP